MSGTNSTILVERSIFRNNQRGIATFNLLVHAGNIDATFRDNFFFGNTVAGLQLGGGSYGSDDSRMQVFSAGNRFEGNSVGVALLNGWHGSSGFKASDRNSLTLVSQRDVYLGNAYGVRVQNALIGFPLSAPSSGNATRVDILSGTFVGNRYHLHATAWSDLRVGGSGTVGTDNTVELLIRNTASSGEATFAICGGSPAEPSNRVVLIGSDTALETANDGVLLEECPPAE